eukprot:jgi/Galph1/52/GphlegSOOS_G4779.1
MANGFDNNALRAVANYIDTTLSPVASVRRNAEAFLQSNEKTQGFSLLLMEIISSDQSFELSTRQAAAVYLKNYIKRSWEDVEDSEKEKLKRLLTDNVLQQPAVLRRLLTETLSVVADSEFPNNWEYLLPELCTKLIQAVSAPTHEKDNWLICLGVLETIDSLVECYRNLFRSDELLMELKYVLGFVQDPLLKTLQLLSENYLSSDILAEDNDYSRTILEITHHCCRIFYSLCYQDLPEYFEDHMEEWARAFLKILNFSSPHTNAELSAIEFSFFEKVQAQVLDNVTLFAEKYEEEFRPYLERFVSATWSLLVRHGNSAKYDQVITSGMGLLTTVSKSVDFGLFSDVDTLKQVCEYIIIPNVELREEDQDLFEENPTEYIRQDMEGSDAETRRRAVCELVKGLCTHYEGTVTEIFSNYVYNMLQEYSKDPMNEWKGKDAAIYLVTAIGWKGGSDRIGATVVNPLVNISEFYKNYIMPELEAASKQVNEMCFPILSCDSIKFATTFRKQIPEELLPKSLFYMTELLSCPLPVVHTYSCISIEKFLALQENGIYKIKKESVISLIPSLVERLLLLMIDSYRQNEYTVKCFMRIIIFFGTEMTAHFENILNGLLKTLEVVSQNPGNPQFIHYSFECLAGLIRYICAKNPTNYLTLLETKLFAFFQSVLASDIAEFVPYVFQILAQLAELRGDVDELPASYHSLLPALFNPSLWNRSGYIPGMVRLLQAFLRKSLGHIIANDQLKPILGIFQKLVASKVHDHYGMILIDCIVDVSDVSHLQPYLPEIMQIMLVRLQKGRTIKFTRAFIVFLSLLSIKCGSETVVSLLNHIQTGLFLQIIEHVWLPGVVREADSDERKICVTGLALLLSCPVVMEHSHIWLATLSTALSLLQGYHEDTGADTNNNVDQSTEYDVQFSQLTLAASQENNFIKKIPASDQVRN